jgi:hypothetical protein
MKCRRNTKSPVQNNFWFAKKKDEIFSHLVKFEAFLKLKYICIMATKINLAFLKYFFELVQKPIYLSGRYLVTHRIAVKEKLANNSVYIGNLQKGEIVELVDIQSTDERIRGQIARHGTNFPGGWITLQRDEPLQKWVEPIFVTCIIFVKIHF